MTTESGPGTGVASDEAGLSSLRDVAASASPPKASIPNADEPPEYIAKCATAPNVHGHKSFRVFAGQRFLNQEEAQRHRQRLAKALATLKRARGWLAVAAADPERPATSDVHKVLAEVDEVLAQGIEAPSGGETRSGSTEGKSPVAAGHAPEPCIASPNPTTKGESK